MHLKIVRAMILGLAMSGIAAGTAAAQATCFPEGLYLEDWLPHVRGDGTEEPGKQKIVEYREYQGKVYVGGTAVTCLGGILSGHEILSVGPYGWRRKTPPDPVIADINALQLPIDVSGTISPDGRNGMVEITQFWFWWNDEALTKHETYAQDIRLTRLDARLLLLRKDVDPVELTPGGPPVELPSDESFAFEIEILNVETLPQDSETWLDLSWLPGIPQANSEQGFYSFRGLKATAGGKASLRTGWQTPKIVTEVTPEEWNELGGQGNLLIQAGQTIEVGLPDWGESRQALVFTQKMPEPKDLYFVRVVHDTEIRIDPATATPGDDLRVVAVYESDVAMETGSVLLRSDTDTLSISVTRAPDDPRTFKSAIIRMQEAQVKAEEAVATDPPPEAPTTSPTTDPGGDTTAQ